MSFIGNELVPNMTAVLDRAIRTKIVEQTEYSRGVYDGAMEMMRAFTEVFCGECEIVLDGLWHELVFRPIENKAGS